MTREHYEPSGKIRSSLPQRAKPMQTYSSGLPSRSRNSGKSVMFHLPPKKSFINRWGHALRIPQTQLCTLHLAIFAACLFVVSPGVQAQQTSGDLAGTLQQLPADDCGCRNMPGGYPCRGACQPCMMGVDCACGRGAEQPVGYETA